MAVPARALERVGQMAGERDHEDSERLRGGRVNSWTPLWSSIVESSIWEEDDATCKVFVTMLAIKDPDHVVRKSAYQIGKKANKTEEQVLAALDVLSSPDRKRLEKQEFEGRRIEKVADGWLVLNGQKYQEMVQDMVRQRQQAQWQREQRAIERAVRNGETLNPANLTPSLKARYDKAKAKFNRKNGARTDDGRIGDSAAAGDEMGGRDLNSWMENGRIPPAV